MPNLFSLYGYIVYFWSNENTPNEPIHIHIAKGKPTKDANKYWLAKGGFFVPDKTNIPNREELKVIDEISDEISIQRIKTEWKSMFGEMKYYC